MAKMITDSQKDELTKRFEAIDLDKNGEIDKEEMK
jgi:Ca2+-binding EF-hand superfamily protein